MHAAGARGGAGHAEGAARTTDGRRPLRGSDVTVGQEALAFSSGLPAAAGTGAGLAAW